MNLRLLEILQNLLKTDDLKDESFFIAPRLIVVPQCAGLPHNVFVLILGIFIVFANTSQSLSMCGSCERSKDVKKRGDVFKVRRIFLLCSLALVASLTFTSEEVLTDKILSGDFIYCFK